ncbi:hypothetical protein ABW20_dc0108099 [Dactylellina cionopaga]|nr:hypothetical protein ABW20_dc0108099 [Dactylellina cionopaga]
MVKADGICAPVVLEFVKYFPARPAFTLEVQYISQRELEQEARIFWEEVISASCNGEIDPESTTTKAGKAAYNRFYSLFGNSECLESLTALQATIHEFYNKDYHLQIGSRIIYAGNEKNCAAALKTFALSPGKDKPDELETWAIIRSVRVYLDAEILNTGAILVDIPGIDDPGTRVAINQDYIAKAQELFIISRVSSILTNNDIEEMKPVGYEGVIGIDGRGRANDYLEPHATSAFSELFGNSDATFNVFRVNPIDYFGIQKRSSQAVEKKRDDCAIAAIVELREFIGSMAYPRMYRLATTRFREGRAILGNILLWAGPEAFKLSKEARAKLKHTLERALACFDADLKTEDNKFAGNITTVMSELMSRTNSLVTESREQSSELIADALETYSTVKAICRADGEVDGGSNWNCIFLYHMKTNLAGLWKKVIEHMRRILNAYQETLDYGLKLFGEGSLNILKKNMVDARAIEVFESLISHDIQRLRDYLTELSRDDIRMIHYHFK